MVRPYQYVLLIQMNLSTIKSKLSNLFRKDLARNTLWLLLAKLFRIVIQAGYFIIVARTLGAENYGSFISVTALGTLAFPFVGLGSEHILIKCVSTDKNLFSLYCYLWTMRERSLADKQTCTESCSSRLAIAGSN